MTALDGCQSRDDRASDELARIEPPRFHQKAKPPEGGIVFCKPLFTFVCLISRQYNYTFYELHKQLENQVVPVQKLVS